MEKSLILLENQGFFFYVLISHILDLGTILGTTVPFLTSIPADLLPGELTKKEAAERNGSRISAPIRQSATSDTSASENTPVVNLCTIKKTHLPGSRRSVPRSNDASLSQNLNPLEGAAGIGPHAQRISSAMV